MSGASGAGAHDPLWGVRTGVHFHTYRGQVGNVMPVPRAGDWAFVRERRPSNDRVCNVHKPWCCGLDSESSVTAEIIQLENKV